MSDSLDRRQALTWLTSLGALATSPVRAQNARSIVLGQSAPITGPAAQLGLQMNQGARLYFDALNAQGGVNGLTVDLRLLDDGYEPDRCKANTEAFIRDDVFALFGYVGTPTTLAALPLANEHRVPLFGPFTGAQALRDPFSRYVIHVRASYFDETALIVRQLTGLGLKKIAVFRQNDSYGQAGYDGVKRALAKAGLEPVAVGLVERNSVDVAAAVQVVTAAKPDAVVQISAYKSCAAFIRAARKAGYGGTFYNVSFVGTQALADELGKEGNGVMVSQVMPFPFNTTTGIARDYLDAIKHSNGKHQANYSGMEGYVAARVFAEGLRRTARPATREGFITAIEGMQRLDLGGFAVSYGPRNHVASSLVDLTMITEDGRVRR